MATASFAPRPCASMRCPAALPSTSAFAARNRPMLTTSASALLAPIPVSLVEAKDGASMTSTHESRNFFLEGPAGRLEAILWTPSAAASLPLAAVVCHPHPLFGGTMHNKVVYQAAKSLDAIGVPVLRFNFRGAGLSAGVHDRGLGEQGDVRAALDYLVSEFPGVPLLLAGFSFGAW